MAAAGISIATFIDHIAEMVWKYNIQQNFKEILQYRATTELILSNTVHNLVTFY